MKLLGWSWSLGRLRGVDIRFHFSTLFSIPIAYYLFKPVDLRGAVETLLWVSGLLLFVFLHELGHAFAAQLVGVKVKSLVMWLMGGLTNLAYKPEKPLHNLFIFAAGPLVNMLLAFVCVFLYGGMVYLSMPLAENAAVFIWLQTFQNLFFSLALVNLILTFFNLLPVYPLDGGNILHAATEWLFGKNNADWITLLISIPFLFLLVALGWFARDYVLLFFCILIAFGIATLNRSSLRWVNLGVNYLFRRAGYYFLLGDYERAAQIYTQEIERHPDRAGNYLSRGGCYLVMGQKERSQADIERALKIDPDHMLALQLRGELYALEKNYDAALDLFARAQAINPHWAVPYFDRASVLLDRGELQPALSEFNHAISLNSRTPLFYLVRSLAHFRLGDLESARRDQDTAVQMSPSETLVMAEVNLILYEGNLDWARDFYERILLTNPRNALALQGYGDACRMNREFVHAEALYSRALAVNPKEPRLYLGRGKTYLELNDSQKAKADFEKALSVSDKLHLKRQSESLLKALPAFP